MKNRQFIIESHWGRAVDKCVRWGLWIVIGMQIGMWWPALTSTIYPYLITACISVFLVRMVSQTSWFQPASPSSRIFGGISLDRAGEMLNLKRHTHESDEDYRKRIDERISVR